MIYHISQLHQDLASLNYRHGGYRHFRISDPKPRDIHKASVRDRLLHHAVYRVLYPYFDARFIADSYSCRIGKGTHRAMNRFRAFAYQVSKNHTRTSWVLKCDVRKFFASIDHQLLFAILEQSIPDQNILALLREVVSSFCSCCGPNKDIHQQLPTGRCKCMHKGLPLGNLTSQLLINVYMNKFDQFVKHTLKAKHYIRYADDFVVLSSDKKALTEILSYMKVFLREELKLELHPNKVSVQTFSSGVDFLGWVHFSDHRVLRTASKRRMFRRLQEQKGDENTKRSYLGLLSHGNTQKLKVEVLFRS